MLFLDSLTMKVYDEKEDYLGERSTHMYNAFAIIVENGTCVHYEHMLYIPITLAIVVSIRGESMMVNG